MCPTRNILKTNKQLFKLMSMLLHNAHAELPQAG